MTKIEFLDGLRIALSSDMSSQELQDNLNYYSQYMDDEMRKGRTEQAVLDELGDPWMIARTIIDAKGGTTANETVYEADNREYSRTGTEQRKANVMLLNTWWKKLLLIICIVGIIMLLFAIITGIVSLIAPIVIPVLVIVMLVKLIKGRK